MSTRRQFISDCSTAVAGLALVPMGAIGLSAMTPQAAASLERMSYPALASQVNTTFWVHLPSRRVVKLKLLKAPLARPTPATPGCRPPSDVGNEKFSLIFSGPKEALLASAIHRFEHGQLGRFEMHIGQIGTPDAEGVRYEAVFNQPARAAAARTNPT